jgi:phosphonate transport system substrate-binding protein
MNLNRPHLVRTFIIVILAFYASISHAETPATYTFSVVPQFKPAQLQQEWAPLLERISLETGIKLKLVIASTIPKFEAEFGKGTPDFAYMNPYQSVLAMKGNGYLPMLRDKKPLNGILVVRKDSPYKKIQDLNGKIIGFPSPNAFGASLYMRALLSEEANIKFTPRYLNNHTLVFRHVALGHVEAGGSVTSALNDEAPEMRNQLTVLYQTPDVASHPIVAHPRVPANVRKSVINSLLGMQQDADGRALLKEIRMSNLVDANFQNDYQPLDKLNIQKYLVQEAE